MLFRSNLSVTDRDYETELDAATTSIDRLVTFAATTAITAAYAEATIAASGIF